MTVGTTDKRSLLVAAAARVMARRGVSGATTKEIASEAGVAEGTIYNHFADKLDLCLAVISSRMNDMFRNLSTESGRRSVRGVLVEVVEERLQVVHEVLPLFAAVVGDPVLAEQFRERTDAHLSKPFDALTTYIKSEQDAGRIGTDVEALVLARLLLGCTFHHSFMTQVIGEENLELSGKRFIEKLVDAVLKAAGAPRKG